MSDVPIQGDAMRRMPPYPLSREGSGREDRPPDDAKGPPAGPREACPPGPPGRADAAASPAARPSSRRRLPTGLY